MRHHIGHHIRCMSWNLFLFPCSSCRAKRRRFQVPCAWTMKHKPACLWHLPPTSFWAKRCAAPQRWCDSDGIVPTPPGLTAAVVSPGGQVSLRQQSGSAWTMACASTNCVSQWERCLWTTASWASDSYWCVSCRGCQCSESELWLHPLWDHLLARSCACKRMCMTDHVCAWLT